VGCGVDVGVLVRCTRSTGFLELLGDGCEELEGDAMGVSDAAGEDEAGAEEEGDGLGLLVGLGLGKYGRNSKTA